MRIALISLLTAPPLVVYATSGTLSLYVGDASPGAQAPYFAPPPSEPAGDAVYVESTRRIVPSDGIPPTVTIQKANNNLDVTRHAGRVYLAFRTAPDHFASASAVIHVVSSGDERLWREETTVSVGSDVREPRLLSLGDSLFLYVSKLGKNRYAFEPSGVVFTERHADGTWEPPADAHLPKRILWRTRVVGGRAIGVAYVGGANIYDFSGDPLDVELLTTTDGREWTPANPEFRTMYEGGASEADFTVTAGGQVLAVARNEAGDGTGWGSVLCTAPALGLPWECVHDAKKYDSPFVFAHGSNGYVVARRNVTRTGVYDVGWGPRLVHGIVNELEYISTGKRCSLWRFADGGKRLAFVLDLPSRGDTCFPAVLDGATENTKIVYDYSSDIHGADVAWSVGQRGPTYIYRHELRFTGR